MGHTVGVVQRSVFAASAIALGLACTGFVLARANHEERWPFEAWSGTDALVWAVAVGSGAAMAGAAGWLSWRLPHNPTGPWLAAAAVTFCAWVAGYNWPSPVSAWSQELLPPVFKAAAVLAVLPWPTGRLERAWSRPLRIATLAYVAIGVLLPFVGTRFSGWANEAWMLPSVGDLVLAAFSTALGAILLGGVAPALLIAALARRQSSIPRSLRPATRPAFIGIGVLAVTEVLVVVWDDVLSSIPRAGPGRGDALDTLRQIVDVGRFGLIAVLLVVAENVRHRRAGSVVAQSVSVDGRMEERPVDVASILADPSARLVDMSGAADTAGRPGDQLRNTDGRPTTGRIELADQTGRLLAVVTHDPAVTVDQRTLDAFIAAVELDVIRAARRADADARTEDVRAVQRRVLEAHDRARRQLERDLHDGAQQRLVALALQASRAQRHMERQGHIDDDERDDLFRAITDAVESTRDLLREGAPAVLDPGLAAGLAALDATIPMATSLEVEGDVPREHPAASALWFVASEAVANSLKHAGATEIGLRLRVDGRVAGLTVVDDGVGGSPTTPPAIVRRLEVVPSDVEVESPRGGGTAIHVRVHLLLGEATP